MKKVFIFLFLSIFLVRPVFAETSMNADSKLSTSDLIYADIALRGYLDNMSVSYEDGNPVDSIALNSDRQWLPASTVKLYVAMYAFKHISEGKLRLTDIVTIDEANVVPTEMDSSDLPLMQSDDKVSISRLLRQMIIQSDNTAYNELLDILDRQEITKYINDIGLIHSHVGSKLNQDTVQEQLEFSVPGYGINTTTADDYTHAFLKIKNYQIPGARELFDILKQQKINNMLPALLPKDVTVAHKTGDLNPLYHDGGIVVSNKGNYVLSIFSNAGDPGIIAHESDLIYTNDYNLVGNEIAHPTTTGISGIQMDPLVMAEKAVASHILGDTSMPFVQVPEITAADLGITAKDLSLVIPDYHIPRVLISADSPLHPFITALDFFAHIFAKGQKMQTQVDMGVLLQKVAEARDLIIRGKQPQAELIIADIQPLLTEISQRRAISGDAQLQTAIQSLSETRFSLLADMLKHTNGIGKKQLIKLVALQSREMEMHVISKLPKSINATNPSQKPVIAKVISSTSNSVTIRTAGGSTVTIPIPSTVKIRSKTDRAFVSDLKRLSTGTTIAMVGTYVGNTFTPSFIMKDIPRQLAAPQPERVVKVDISHDRLVVSDNGVLLQVEILPQTVIKGSDTLIPLKAIRPGDIVIVHGTPVSVENKQVQPLQSSPVVTPTSFIKPTASQFSVISLSPTLTVGNTVQSTNASTGKPNQQGNTSQQSPNVEVIKSTTVQVIEKNKDVPTPPAKPSSSEQPSKPHINSEPPRLPTKKP